MIKGCDVKRFHPGLIIRHPDIHFLLILAGIDPVDLPAAKPHLISTGEKVPFLKLLCQRPHGAPDQALDAADHILVPGRAEQHCIPIIKDALLHALIDQFFPLFLGQFRPFHPFLLCLAGETFQRLMGDISQVHGFKPVLLPVREPETIVQEMSVSAGRELLQPGHADPVRIFIELCRRIRSQPVAALVEEARTQDLPDRCPALLVPVKPGVQFLPGIAYPAPTLPQSFRQHPDPSCPGHLPLRERTLLLVPDFNIREKSADILDQVCRAQCLPVPGHLGPGQEQILRRFGQVHVEVKFLLVSLLLRSRG